MREEVYDTETVKANLILVSSKRIGRVCSSTLQAETIMLTPAIDRGYSIKCLLEKNLGKKILFMLATDCASIIDHVITANLSLSSKRLQIDMSIVRESLENKIIDHLIHQPSSFNNADEATKFMESKLDSLIQSNRLPFAVHRRS